MNLSIETSVEHSGVVVVVVRGAIEHDRLGAFAAAVDAALHRHRPVELHMDLGLVTYMEAAAVGVLAECRRRAASGGARLVVRHASPPVRRLLDVSGVGDAPP